MSTKEKVPQFILKVPAGLKMPAGTQISQAPVRETAPPALVSAPAPAPAPQPEVKVTESYLSAKLRQRERGGQPKSMPAPVGNYDTQMADMWREMEDQISFKAPKAAQLPADFLRSMGLEGETILISPRAVEALKDILGGKKNG